MQNNMTNTMIFIQKEIFRIFGVILCFAYRAITPPPLIFFIVKIMGEGFSFLRLISYGYICLAGLEIGLG